MPSTWTRRAAVAAAPAGPGRRRGRRAELAEGPLAGLRVGALHGRLPADEKDAHDATLSRAGEVDVLVSTTVIEVGVDVPNATVMVMLDADRFGVSQLHQLRGRVGRGGHPGLCLLVTAAEAGQRRPGERLDAVAATTDGFELSRVDLEQRREGDVLGASQSGVPLAACRALRVLRDEEIILAAREAAEALLAADPELAATPPWPAAVVRPGATPWQSGLPGEVVTRIIGGAAGGRRLATPPGGDTRPTSDRVREALFSAIEAWCGSLAGLRFLDLYAGLRRGRPRGLVPRGRAWSRCVEHDRRTAALIARQRPVARLHPGRRGHRAGRDARWRARPGRAVRPGLPRPALPAAPTEAVAADLAALRRPRLAGRRARWSWSSAPPRSPDPAWPDGLRGRPAKRKYGETVLWYGHAATARATRP